MSESAEGRDAPPPPPFILYLDGDDYAAALDDLMMWVNNLLLPVYGREVASHAPWCPRWWRHHEAVAVLYSLWMAWQELTDGEAGLTGPAVWHRDYLVPLMGQLRDPNGPFAGCKLGGHRPKESPPLELERR